MEVLLRGQPLGATNANGHLAIRGVSQRSPSGSAAAEFLLLQGQERLVQLAEPLRGRPLYAAYAPRTGTDAATVLLLDSVDELALTLGDRPHAVALNPVDWSCASVAFAYDASANTLEAEPTECSEPAVLDLSCPVSLRAGDVGVFEARLSGRGNVPVEWSMKDTDGLDLNVDYGLDGMEGESEMMARINATWASFNRAMAEEREAIVTASYGDVEEECRLMIEALESAPYAEEPGPAVRGMIGYNFEFGAVSGKVGASVPIPVGAPLYGDVSVGYFSEGSVGYGLLLAELQCRMAMTPLMTLFYGGGLHLLRESNDGNSNLELGPGISGRVQYDGGWAVEPAAEVSLSYHYSRVIPTLSVGASYRFNQ